MCRGKVDQWTGGQDNTGALVTTGQLWSVRIMMILLHQHHVLTSPHLTSPQLCVSNIQNNDKLDNIKIYAAIQSFYSEHYIYILYNIYIMLRIAYIYIYMKYCTPTLHNLFYVC